MRHQQKEDLPVYELDFHPGALKIVVHQCRGGDFVASSNLSIPGKWNDVLILDQQKAIYPSNSTVTTKRLERSLTVLISKMWWAKDPETKLLVKIDWFILSFCCVTYFFNYLDRSNLTNAYVSGMEEELSFQGNQLNQINTVFTVGYIIGQIPSNLALTYLRPRIFFPAMILCWGCTYVFETVAHCG
jgi:hypothetical protein